MYCNSYKTLPFDHINNSQCLKTTAMGKQISCDYYKKSMASSSSSLLNMHKNSHSISKGKPRIRIIHIFAPEVIKTDAANFRDLVQRLTGKPAEEDANHNKKKYTKKPTSSRKIDSEEASSWSWNGGLGFGKGLIKGEEDVWDLGFVDHHFAAHGMIVDDADDVQFPFMEGTTTAGTAPAI